MSGFCGGKCMNSGSFIIKIDLHIVWIALNKIELILVLFSRSVWVFTVRILFNNENIITYLLYISYILHHCYNLKHNL